MSENDQSEHLAKGIALAQQGKLKEAQSLLTRIVQVDDRNLQAWLWLSAVVDNREDKIICLENVLTIDPNHYAARQGLHSLYSSQELPDTQISNDKDRFLPEEYTPVPGATTFDWEGAKEFEKLPNSMLAKTESPPDSTKICIHCGTVNPSWRDICSLCGQAFEPPVKSLPEGSSIFPSVADNLDDEVILAEELDTRSQGMLTIGAAWMAALTFNKRGAYEVEIFSASVGRTILGLILGSLLIPGLVLLLVGALVAISISGDTMALLASLAAAPIFIFCGGITGAVGVIAQFYLWSICIYTMAWLLGGKSSFVIQSHLLSISYSASNLVGSILMTVGIAFATILTDITSASGSFPFQTLGGILVALLGLVITVYSVAMQGQAISVAHRFTWFKALGAMLLAGLIFGLLTVFVSLVLFMVIGNTPIDLPLQLTAIPLP